VTQPRDGAKNAASDEQLLAEFLGGGEAAFAVLVERYSAELFQFVVRFVGNPAAAEDVVQETFVQLYQSAAGFDPGRRLRPWLFTIAANKARDHLRSRQRRRELPLGGSGGPEEAGEVTYLDFLAEDSASPSQELEISEQAEAVREIIEEMPDSLREILVFSYFHHFSYKEMAEMLGIPLGTVKSRLHAAVSYFARAYKKRQNEQAGEPDPRGGSSSTGDDQK
jgi:RNA polymerase sigma-70 factor, ECF subfamily